MGRDFRHTLSAGLATALIAGQALAGGAPSGTAISNTISVSYESGGEEISLDAAPAADLTVDQRLSFTFVALGDTTTVNVEPGSQSQEMRFLLTNTGNEPVAFDIDLEAIEDQLGLTYDPAGGGAEGTYSVVLRETPEGEGRPYDPAGLTSTGAIAPDASITVVLRASIPRGAGDGALTALQARARPLAPGGSQVQSAVRGQGPGAIDIVFGDPGQDGAEIREASYQVLAPQLSAVKDVIVVSENRGGGFACASGAAEAEAGAFIPGACVEYAITLSNAPEASSPATFLEFNDTLPETVTFASIFKNNGFDDVAIDGATLNGTIASLAPGTSATVRVRATVN